MKEFRSKIFTLYQNYIRSMRLMSIGTYLRGINFNDNIMKIRKKNLFRESFFYLCNNIKQYF